MKIEVTEEEIHEIARAFVLLANFTNKELVQSINWEIISKFLAKLDK